MNVLVSTILLAVATVLTPTKHWYAPTHPLTIDVKAGGEATLVLTDFSGKVLDPKAPADVAADKTVNLRDLYREVDTPGTYVLFVVKKGAAKDLASAPTDFIGTPLVVNVRQDTAPGAPPGVLVVNIVPLRYALMTTASGPIKMAFYFDVAPNTAAHFLRLSEEGFYNGIGFHRIVPGFVIQGGDPRGDGTGGPGYTIVAEFNARPHKEGVLSMARKGDPSERSGAPPRPEFANSASSQFFICLDYNNTSQLDRKYTAFGEVTEGMDAVKKIAQAQLIDPANGRPRDPQIIEKVEVLPVTAADNPYVKILKPADAK